MRGTVAKRLRREAEQETKGMPIGNTKLVYKLKKRAYKR